MTFDLFVDTSRKGISMALLETGAAHYTESIDELARGETASAMLDALLEKAHATLDQVTRVMVTLGPGSFSGLSRFFQRPAHGSCLLRRTQF